MMPVTVITGGSGQGASGIGAALTAAFHGAGHTVIVIDQQPPTGETQKILSLGKNRFYQCDLTDKGAVQDVCFQIKSDIGPIHHLISNAGGGLSGEFQNDFISEDEWDQTIARNLSSHYYMIKNLRPLFDSASDDCSILLVSSINAIQGYGLTGYSAAKAGLLGLMNAIAPVLGRDQIRINCLLPGTVSADIKNEDKDYGLLTEQSCLKKMARAEDVAKMACSITQQPHMTGAQIVLDGGQSIFRSQK